MSTSCRVGDCDGGAVAHGLCQAHYARWRRYGDPTVGGPVKRRRASRPCVVEGCEVPDYAQGLCNMHYQRAKRGGPIEVASRLRAPPGTGYVDRSGYRILFLPSHPNANRSGKVAEHVVVMAEVVGRPLRKGETVHHRNGDPSDNRPDNLELWVSAHPPGQRVQDLLAWARQIIEEYEPIERRL